VSTLVRRHYASDLVTKFHLERMNRKEWAGVPWTVEYVLNPTTYNNGVSPSLSSSLRCDTAFGKTVLWASRVLSPHSRHF
jgi:hypothetical protein